MNKDSIREQLFGSEYKQELIKMMHPDWNIDFYRDEKGEIQYRFGHDAEKAK